MNINKAVLITMKKILSLLSVIFLTFGCYDDSDIRNELRDHEERLAKLETLCKQMNTNISALQTIVSTLQKNVFVTAVTPIKEGSDIVGYTISFSNSESVTIYHGRDGVDGEDGTDGADGVNGTTPSIGVRQDTDGIYYWTLDGEWLLDATGKKVQAVGRDGSDGAAGKTPQLKIENGYWYVSYDGTDWSMLGKAAGESANLIEITQDAENVFFKLKDGTVLTVPKGCATGLDLHVLVSEIFELSASFEGNVGDNGWSEVGVILSTESGCPLDKSLLIPITETDEKGKFVVGTEGLASGTKYYYSGYATDGDIYVFGEEKSFVTKPVKITHAIEILDVGTRSAKVVVNWEMSCLDPSIVLGLKYGAYGSTLDEYHPVESPQQTGSYEFDLEGFSPNGDYECSFYYIVNGVEKEGERHDLNLIEVPLGQEGLNFRFDKSLIKADGVDCVTFNILYDGIDVSDKGILYLVEDGNYVPVTGMSFSTSVEGEYLFCTVYKTTRTDLIKIHAIDGDIPDPLIDPSPESTNFSHRVFLNQHTGVSCPPCPYMTRFLREALNDEVNDMVVLSVLRNYLEQGFANVPNPGGAWPHLTFDSIRTYNYNSSQEIFRNDIKASVAEAALVGISANPVYNAVTNQIIVTVSVKAAVAGVYNVGLWLMQDNYYAIQSLPYGNSFDESYHTHHNNVRVAEPENTQGYPLGYLSAGQTAERSYIFEIKDTWWTDVNLDDLHFAAFVTTKSAGYVKNVNVIDFKYNEAKPFEYLVETK